MVRRVLPAATEAEAGAVCDRGREPNFGSLETIVGMVGGSTRGGVDIRLRPLHHGATELHQKKSREAQ